ETKEEVQKFPLRSYEEVLEGSLQIDQVAIDSGRKTYEENGKLVTLAQNTPGYPNNMENNQGPNILNKNHGFTNDDVTDQPKNPNVVNPTNNGVTNSNNNN
ncbi:hypothetical protein KI387_033290, partial [Taxus chinensis]